MLLDAVFEKARKEEIMRTRFMNLFGIVVLAGIASVAAAQTVVTSSPSVHEIAATREARTQDDVIDRIIARERDEIKVINSYDPIIETYVQVYSQKRNGDRLLSRDYYYLGQAELSDRKQFGYRSMLARKDQYPKRGFVDASFNPLGFVQMVYIDQRGFDREHYRFRYVGQEFLGNVRCVVFDVQPLQKALPGRFSGRIWAEDKNDTIVRFNGIYLPVSHRGHFNSHFDSWRLNVQPGLWLPAYGFAEETDLRTTKLQIKYVNDLDHLRFKAQTRFWGYDLKEPRRQQEFSDLIVEAPTRVNDSLTVREGDQSPVQAQRQWQSQAENNVLAALERTGLLAPAGEVDKTLDTVVNNLEITNNLDIEPAVRCRVLTTATFDLFAVGHVIVISRGLIDVLPDEATLATMLAQALGQIIVSKSHPDQYAFYDIVQLPSLDALRRFSFKLNDREREASSEKAVDLLRNSPYKDNLASAGLFLKEFEQDSRNLRALVAPHLGNGVIVASQLTSAAPALQPENLNQIAALPLGARIKLDPWTDEAALIKARPTPLVSAREKMPLELTPFMPYLTRYAKQTPSEESSKVIFNENGSQSPPGPNK
ncbi:MAG: hypothetical protein WCD43_03820 [Candidatus Acidiferrales bacterium]